MEESVVAGIELIGDCQFAIFDWQSPFAFWGLKSSTCGLRSRTSPILLIPRMNVATGQQEPINLANVRKVYFDTSAWNYSAKHSLSESLVHALKGSGTIILASVISAGEVLRISDPILRELVCSTIRNLHGDGHLLERPLDIAKAVAEAFLRGEIDCILPRTGSGEAIYSHLENPSSPPSEELRKWLHNMDDNLNRFIEKTKPPHANPSRRYCTPPVIGRDEFLRLLCQFPPAKELGLSVSHLSQLCQASDIWKALGATLAYMMELSATHAPKSRHGKKRPGGPDLWQTLYLGVSEVFVTGDEGQLSAACTVSACLKYPRCVVSTRDFADGVLQFTGRSATSQGADSHSCRLCGCKLPTPTGMHVSALLA